MEEEFHPTKEEFDAIRENSESPYDRLLTILNKWNDEQIISHQELTKQITVLGGLISNIGEAYGTGTRN